MYSFRKPSQPLKKDPIPVILYFLVREELLDKQTELEDNTSAL